MSEGNKVVYSSPNLEYEKNINNYYSNLRDTKNFESNFGKTDSTLKKNSGKGKFFKCQNVPLTEPATTGYEKLLQSFNFNSAEEIRQKLGRKRFKNQHVELDLLSEDSKMLASNGIQSSHYMDAALSESTPLDTSDDSSSSIYEDDDVEDAGSVDDVNQEGYFDKLDVLEFENLMKSNADHELALALKNGEVEWEEEINDVDLADEEDEKKSFDGQKITSNIHLNQEDSEKSFNKFEHADDTIYDMFSRITEFSLNLDYICDEPSEDSSPTYQDEQDLDRFYMNHFIEKEVLLSSFEDFHNDFCEIENDSDLGLIYATSRVKDLDSVPVNTFSSPDYFQSEFLLKKSLSAKWCRFYEEAFFNGDKAACVDKNDLDKRSMDLQEKKLFATTLQSKLYSLISKYVDVFYAASKSESAFEIIPIYVVHIINHVITTRNLIMAHDNEILQYKKKRSNFLTEAKILQDQINSKETLDAASIEHLKHKKNDLFQQLDSLEEPEYRDQGFSRPTVLVLLPMRNSALFFFEVLRSLVPASHARFVENKNKFYQLFYKKKSYHSSHSKEWNLIFQGMNDDSFCFGISFLDKKLMLFSELMHSDIIVASPLKLRVMFENDPEICDCFSSIEILVLDQADVIEMQNWDHVNYVLNRINKIPLKTHNTDFSRVKKNLIENCGIYYRQTLIFGQFQSVCTNASFNRLCHNWAGKVKIKSHYKVGVLDNINSSAQQTFYKLVVKDHTEVDEKRFEHFQSLCMYIEEYSANSQLMIFIPSYFDFLKVKDYLKKKNELKLVFNSEYSTKSKIKKNFRLLSLNEAQAMVMTERFYFYYEKLFKPIKNVIFYSPPQHQQYYQQIVNHLPPDSMVLLLFTNYDFLQMERILGRDKAITIFDSPNKIFRLLVQ